MALRPAGHLRTRFAWAGLVLVLAVPVWWGAHASFPWDVDNIAPGSVLKAMVARFGPGWSSSYGPVPYQITAAVYAPVLGFLWLAGEADRPAAEYPFGFRHPDAVIMVLVVAARLATLALALGVAALAARAARAAPAAPAAPAATTGAAPRRRTWLVPVLLAGSATFVYYARTSNVDMYALFFAWLAFALVEVPAPSLARCAGAAAAAALAVCCKEQIAPFAVVAGLVACTRAWRGSGAGAAAIVALAGVAAYALVWLLPVNVSGWLAHHRFIFEMARYPRTFAATAAGYGALAWRCLEQAPLTFGWPVLAGLVAAALARPRLRGLGPRAIGAALYLAVFLGSIGYVYPRFLLPLMLLALPVAARGLDAALDRLAPRAGAALAAALVALALVGGPVLDVVMLRDPRLEVERWLAGQADPKAVVEVAGNPHFQARVPPTLRRLVTSPDSLRLHPRGPEGDVVLVSSIDVYALRRLPGDAYLRALESGGGYRLELTAQGPPLSRLVAGLPVAPEVKVYVRQAGAAR